MKSNAAEGTATSICKPGHNNVNYFSPLLIPTSPREDPYLALVFGTFFSFGYIYFLTNTTLFFTDCSGMIFDPC